MTPSDEGLGDMDDRPGIEDEEDGAANVDGDSWLVMFINDENDGGDLRDCVCMLPQS